MASENNLILNLPFEEAAGSAVAYDYSRNRHDAAVSGGADFVTGKHGNCLSFDGTGNAEIESNILDLTGNFTIMAWIKVRDYADGVTGKKVGIFCNTSALNGAKVLWVNAPTGWSFFVIRKTGNAIALYVDTILAGTINMSGALTGIAILQDIYGTGYAYADIDEVKMFNVALSDAEIAEEISNVATIDYFINGVNLKEYGIRVESSSGILDLPKMKTPTSSEWADYHGKVIDLTDKRFEEREITLNCWLKANGKIDFATRVNNFYEVFREDGTQRLMISIHPTKPLVYEVYCADGIAQNKRWHDDKMIGTFQLKLREPDPVKRVVRHQKLSAATNTLNVAFKSSKMVNVYWGDGNVDYDVFGDKTGNNKLTHTYENDGIYYAVIAGVIEEMEDFSTNGIVVWNRL